MVDIHTHILPQLDDGASSLEESLEMCAAQEESGVEAVVATPHFYDGSEADAFLERREERLSLVAASLAARGAGLRVLGGAEVALRPVLHAHAKQLRRLTLGGTRYLLAEFPFAPIPMEDLFDYVELIFDQDLVPVIAHPERFSYFQDNYDLLNLLLEKGAVFQVTAQSLVGTFGPKAMQLSWAMLQADAIDCLASDAHEAYGRRGADLLTIRELLASQGVPEDQLARMLEETPGEIVADRELSDREIGFILPPKRFGRQRF